MKKALEEMTLEELWQLFPIFLTEHKACWQDWYKEMKEHLLEIIPKEAVNDINHVGSTAIPGIMAKPIIDILLEINESFDMENIASLCVKDGWIIMNRSEGRIYLNYGYTPNGYAEKVFHLHLRNPGDNKEIEFRDKLIASPEKAKEYEKLKISLWKKYEHDRDGYTFAKGDFVDNIIKEG